MSGSEGVDITVSVAAAEKDKSVSEIGTVTDVVPGKCQAQQMLG